MTPAQQQRLARCIEFLRPIQAAFAESVSEVYWLGARNHDPDQGPSYCRECCDKLVDRLNEAYSDHEYLRDGGWGYEADSPEICEECGSFLNCTLTHCGVDQELKHWATARISLRGKHRAATAFELLLILESASLSNYWLTVPGMQPYEVDRIRGIHRDAKTIIRRIDAMRARRESSKGESNALK